MVYESEKLICWSMLLSIDNAFLQLCVILLLYRVGEFGLIKINKIVFVYSTAMCLARAVAAEVCLSASLFVCGQADLRSEREANMVT